MRFGEFIEKVIAAILAAAAAHPATAATTAAAMGAAAGGKVLNFRDFSLDPIKFPKNAW